MVCTHDLAGMLLSINAHGAQSIGLTREDMIGRPLTEFMPEEHREAFPEYLREVVEEGDVQGLLYLAPHQRRHPRPRLPQQAHRSSRPPALRPRLRRRHLRHRCAPKTSSAPSSASPTPSSSPSATASTASTSRATSPSSTPPPARCSASSPKSSSAATCTSSSTTPAPTASPYPAAECPIQNSLRDLDTVRVANEVFWRKDGTSFPVEYVARPQIEIQNSAKAAKPRKAVGVVVAFTDTTQRRALDKMKDEFISTVSHELRTPLTSLRAALGLVTGGTLDHRPEKLKQMLDIATGNTDRLVRLVNDILELERIGSGKAELHCTMCSADDLFRRAAGLQQTGASKAQLRITFNSQGVNVWADPDRILQTLTNLISNAIKFSTPGTEIHLRSRKIDRDTAEIQVRDQGRGIPQDKLESIFERFHQVDASDSRTMGGTGLGLAICRSIVAQHGGRIWATSTPGQGSTFHFTLPTRPASNLL